MQITYKEAIAFINAGREFLNQKNRKATELSYAISRTLKRLDKHKDDFDELVADARTTYQKKDKDGVLEYHDQLGNAPKFTAEQHAGFRKRFTEIKNTSFEFEPYYATFIPDDLELAWYEYFVPIVIQDYPFASAA